jgi:DNA-directed RNA polymerase subunit M/transcription elongation factor TFIIS
MVEKAVKSKETKMDIDNDCLFSDTSSVASFDSETGFVNSINVQNDNFSEVVDDYCCNEKDTEDVNKIERLIKKFNFLKIDEISVVINKCDNFIYKLYKNLDTINIENVKQQFKNHIEEYNLNYSLNDRVKWVYIYYNLFNSVNESFNITHSELFIYALKIEYDTFNEFFFSLTNELKLTEYGFKRTLYKYNNKMRNLMINLNQYSYLNNKKLTPCFNLKYFIGMLQSKDVSLAPFNIQLLNFDNWLHIYIEERIVKLKVRSKDQLIADNDSMLQCSKCKKNAVEYYQLQTRSADEPITNFCHCLNCDKRWRFC